MIFKIKTIDSSYFPVIINTALIPLMTISRTKNGYCTLHIHGLPAPSDIEEYTIDFSANENPEFIKYMEG